MREVSECVQSLRKHDATEEATDVREVSECDDTSRKSETHADLSNIDNHDSYKYNTFDPR